LYNLSEDEIKVIEGDNLLSRHFLNIFKTNKIILQESIMKITQKMYDDLVNDITTWTPSIFKSLRNNIDSLLPEGYNW